MISLYTSAVLTTAVVAGLAVFSMERSRVASPVVMDSAVMREAHFYGVARGKAALIPTPLGDETHVLPTGPFYADGRAQNLLVLDTEVVDGVNTVQRYVVTTLTPSGEARESTSRRIAGSFRNVQGTTVGIMGPGGSLLGDEPMPPVAVSIPEGAVVAITRIGA